MKIVRTPVLKESKKPMIAMIVIAAFMLITSIADISIMTQNKITTFRFETFGAWTTLFSIIPLCWLLCTILLLKTKKIIFSKLPGYLVCGMAVLGYILYYILAGQDNTVVNFFLFAVVILLIYPIIIATLTLEGRLYNRVFATIFSIILVVLCFAAAVVSSIIMNWYSLTFLLPALSYVELTLAVFCYNLEKPKKKEPKDNKITH